MRAALFCGVAAVVIAASLWPAPGNYDTDGPTLPAADSAAVSASFTRAGPTGEMQPGGQDEKEEAPALFYHTGPHG